MSRQYVAKKDLERLYPSHTLRRKGGTWDNDEFYATYSSAKIVSVLKREAKTVEKAMDAFIACSIADGLDYVLEGYQLSPGFVAKMVKKHGKNVRAVFLTKKNAKQFAKDVHKSTTPNDWLLAITKHEETFERVGEMVSLYSEYFERNAKKYSFPVVNLDRQFSKGVKTAIEKLAK